MEWQNVKRQIEEQIKQDHDDGCYSREAILKLLQDELGDNWQKEFDNELGVECMIAEKIDLEIETNISNDIIEHLQSAATLKAGEYYSKYAAFGAGSKSPIELGAIIDNDIEQLNQSIRTIVYGLYVGAAPLNPQGMIPDLRDKCNDKPLDSKEWEDYYYVSKLFFVIFSLKVVKARIMGKELDSTHVYESYYKKVQADHNLNDMFAAVLAVVQKPLNKFTSKCSGSQLLEVKNQLEKYECIEPTSDKQFLFWFGLADMESPKSIVWKKQNRLKKIDAQAVTELIVLLCGQTNNPAISDCFGISAPKNQPERFQFEPSFYSVLKSQGIH